MTSIQRTIAIRSRARESLRLRADHRTSDGYAETASAATIAGRLSRKIRQTMSKINPTSRPPMAAFTKIAARLKPTG